MLQVQEVLRLLTVSQGPHAGAETQLDPRTRAGSRRSERSCVGRPGTGSGVMRTTRVWASLAMCAGLTLHMGCCSERRMGVDVSSRPLAERLEFYRESVACAVRRDPGASFTVLMEAVRSNDGEAVDHLLSTKADDINAAANGGTSLTMAVMNGNVPMTAKLLAAGADPAYRRPFDLLCVACSQGLVDRGIRLEILRLLLAHGADANNRGEYGFTPLMAARDAQVARLLIEHGARVNDAESRQGMNALHMAVYRKDTSLASVLIEAGTNVNARDAEGQTPLDRAIALGDSPMVSLLENHGGTRGAGTPGPPRSIPSCQ